MILHDVEPRLGRLRRGGVVDGGGHFVHVERPDVVNALILDFLA